MDKFLDGLKWYFTSIWGIITIALVSIILIIVLYRFIFKRIFDIIWSIVAIPFFLILFIPIAIAIKKEDGGPIFYCGKRIGKNGKIFPMIKFRSMKVNAPNIILKDGSTYNAKDDVRVTKVGKFLRETSLDEIPQIFNILLGQMSFIGPRPDPTEWLELYTEEEKGILKVKPGITGYNQAYFRNSVSNSEKIVNDIFYIKKLNFFFDIKILFKTITVVFKRENLYKETEKVEVVSLEIGINEKSFIDQAIDSENVNKETEKAIDGENNTETEENESGFF